jgi:hypothetical protein
MLQRNGSIAADCISLAIKSAGTAEGNTGTAGDFGSPIAIWTSHVTVCTTGNNF